MSKNRLPKGQQWEGQTLLAGLVLSLMIFLFATAGAGRSGRGAQELGHDVEGTVEYRIHNGHTSGAIPYETIAGHRSSISIEGTSTMHPWFVRSRSIDGWVFVPPGLFKTAAPGLPAELSARFSVPVWSLRSMRDGRPYSERMDEIMRERLKAGEHARIHFFSRRAEIVSVGPECLSLVVDGVLTVAGVSRDIQFPVEIRRAPGGLLRVAARADLLMSAFGVEPPVALAGAIRTGDPIVVTVDWLVVPVQPELASIAED